MCIHQNTDSLLIHSNLCKQCTDVIEFYKVKDIFEVADLCIFYTKSKWNTVDIIQNSLQIHLRTESKIYMN